MEVSKYEPSLETNKGRKGSFSRICSFGRDDRYPADRVCPHTTRSLKYVLEMQSHKMDGCCLVQAKWGIRYKQNKVRRERARRVN